MNIGKANESKNAVEIKNTLAAMGYNVEGVAFGENDNYTMMLPNGIGMQCFMLSNGEADRKAGMKIAEMMYRASNDDVMEMVSKLDTIAMMDAKAIIADEMLTIEDTEVIMSYRQGKAYTTDGEEIANCDDVAYLPIEAIKEVLIARVKAELK